MSLRLPCYLIKRGHELPQNADPSLIAVPLQYPDPVRSVSRRIRFREDLGRETAYFESAPKKPRR